MDEIKALRKALADAQAKAIAAYDAIEDLEIEGAIQSEDANIAIQAAEQISQLVSKAIEMSNELKTARQSTGIADATALQPPQIDPAKYLRSRQSYRSRRNAARRKQMNLIY